MNGLDVLVFTAGVGENSYMLREKICSQLTYFGIELDVEANKAKNRGDRIISTPNSKVTVYVIPTNEELVIARDTYRLIANGVASE